MRKASPAPAERRPANGKPFPSQATIARMVGVARSTVSMVLNNDPRIPDPTRRRVLAAAHKIQYDPRFSLDARRLAARRNGRHLRLNTLGLVWNASDNLPPSGFRLRLLNGILEGCQETAQCLLVANLVWERVQILHSLTQIDGVILEGAYAEQFTLARELGKPMVTILSEYPGVADVGIDNAAAIELAFEYLYRRGHRKIAWIGPDLRPSVASTRWAAYCGCLRRAGLAYNPLHVSSGIGLEMRAQAAAAMRQIWNAPGRPTAFLVYNDWMALGALQAGLEMGVRPPRDYSMVSIDDIPEAALAQPPLTTVAIGLQSLGRRAVTLLEEFVRTGSYLPVREQLRAFALKERGSVATIQKP